MNGVNNVSIISSHCDTSGACRTKMLHQLPYIVLYIQTPRVGMLIGVKITRVDVGHERDFDTN